MSHIDDKHVDLMRRGLDLGIPLAPETEAPAGGRMRRYTNGNIYWHPATGAHEVHGGILSVYLANGGPGESPRTGRRELGYPVADELPGVTPRSRFEFGEIFWTADTGGCLVRGQIWGRYNQGPNIGLPITSNFPLAGGEAVFFERGVIYWARFAGKSRVIVGHIEPPLIGKPKIINPDAVSERQFTSFCVWRGIPKDDYDALVGWRPGVFMEILDGRYAYSPVGRRTELIPLSTVQTRILGTEFMRDIHVVLALHSGRPIDLADRTLYDLSILLPSGSRYAVSPHCLYAKKSWDNFGLLHVTDIHVSKRNDELRTKLRVLGLTDAAQSYCNFQQNFRDFIRYANKLYDLGLADIVLATGDLVDYAQEDGDKPGLDNFWRLRRLLLGQAISAASEAGEELRLPIYATFGNHDYRVHPYDYRANIDVPTNEWDQARNDYASHNLIESDAIALQGGRTPTYGLSQANEALRQLWWDQSENAYSYFEKYMARERTYVVALGNNRLVVLDTKNDEGVPANADLALLLNKILGDLNPATERLMSGEGPNSSGFGPKDIQLLRNAIFEAPLDGTVIVGMHAPALSPNSSEYPYYLRETIHPTAEIQALVDYHGLLGLPAMRGKPYFERGSAKDKLSGGIAWTGNKEFLDACAGVGLPRPVDLILCGHVHDRVEYRFRATDTGFRYYTDFYTENPQLYYPTKSFQDHPLLPKGAPLLVEIKAGATLPPVVKVVRDHRDNDPNVDTPPTIYGKITTPPYANPLNSASDPKSWWQAHRPLQVQTSALGPIESRQRYGTFYRLSDPEPKYRRVVESDRGVAGSQSATVLPRPLIEPTFQGFRLVQVVGNVISKIRYIGLGELRGNDFKMPWEDRTFEPILESVLTPRPTE